MFRAKYMRLYDEFEDKLEGLCQEYGVKINCWYSPSKIPQPKFLFGKVALDADTLYNEEEFCLLFSPKAVLNQRHISIERNPKLSSLILF